MYTVAINGLGRIGRAALKVLVESDDLELVAVNDLADAENLAYLLNFDTVYGRYRSVVRSEGNTLVIDGRRIPVFSEADPTDLPWRELEVDVALECTGAFRNEEDLAKHLTPGPHTWSSPPRRPALAGSRPSCTASTRPTAPTCSRVPAAPPTASPR
jgi:glyceraldehyde 3-phosphate dehydrogenase